MPSGRGDELRILTRPWVHMLVVALAVVIAFGPALEGAPVWDDAATIGTASTLESPTEAFSTRLMAASGSAAVYVRPAVTISMWLDLQLFSAAPTVGMHMTNLAWHVLAAMLVLGALRRWTRASTEWAKAACLLAAVFWAVVPQKAESVAWISGRGDAMGLAFVLAALVIRSRVEGIGARAVAIAVGTVLALACKETFVAAPILVGVELASERSGEERSLKKLLRAPELLASAGVVVGYLVLRGATQPIAGGGAGMYTGLSKVDRGFLFLETVGHAISSLFTPWNAELLKGPVAFQSATELVRQPAMATIGVAGIGAIVFLVRALPVLRPCAALLLTFLPVSNLIPTGLESRLSDRFLYMPSLALALAVAIGLSWLLRQGGDDKTSPQKERARGAIVLAGMAAAVALLVGARGRSEHFTSDDVLFSWERLHGDRASSILLNAGTAAYEAGRYRDARDLRLETVDRYRELGFGGEGFSEILDAARFQVLATGEEHLPSMAALYNVLTALDRNEDIIVDLPFEDGRVIGLPTGTPTARAYAAERAAPIDALLAWLGAKVGDPAAIESARAAADACPRCPGVLLTCAEVALMSGSVEDATKWIQAAHDSGARVEKLEKVFDVWRGLIGRGDPKSVMAARFLGGNFNKTCRDSARLQLEGDPAKDIAVAACTLAADRKRLEALGAQPSAEASELRNDWEGREALVRRSIDR